MVYHGQAQRTQRHDEHMGKQSYVKPMKITTNQGLRECQSIYTEKKIQEKHAGQTQMY